MPAAHLDLREDVLVPDLLALAVEIDHGTRDVEERDHLGAVFGHDERMDLPRRLEHEAALAGDPVVFEVAPLPLDDVADDDHRVPVAIQHAALAHAQEVAPAAGHGVEEEWAEPHVLRLRHPDAL